MVSVNLYTNLSTVNCNPIKFSILGNQFTTLPTPIVFNNGIRANVDEFLNNCISFTTNNKTGLLLTDLKKASEFLTDDLKPKDVGLLTEIDSPIVSQNLIKSPLADDKLEILTILPVQQNYQWAVTGVSSFNQNDVFRFVFQPDNSVIVESVKTKYLLTSLFEGKNGLIFYPVITPILSSKNFYVDAQRFDYALGPNTISLFQINDEMLLPRFENAVVKLSSNYYGISSLAYLTSADKFPAEAALNFISYQEKPSLNSDIKDSFLAKYEVNPLNNQKTLTLDLSTANANYSQNYLGIFPPEYYIQTSEGVTYPLAVHGLKNYQTPEYNYSFGLEYIKNQKGVRRKYENIYTGTNQDKGLDNVYLGFTSNTIEIDFPPDKDTPFYFGPTSERISLSASGLIEDGAIAGEVPYTSDRIYIKLQDYSEKIPDSPQPPSITRYSNNWLCSWLSGSLDGDKKWMDRYYNPAYYTINQALSAKVIMYHDRLNEEENYTFDKPSEMYLEPGVLYRYFHTGKQNRLNFIQHLSSNSILQVTKWNSSPLIDESPNQGEGILYFNKESNLLGDSLNLDGTNHVLFPATTQLLAQSQLTVSIWLNTKDWSNMSGKQIFGNYYDSGFGLINEGSLTTPIITLVDSNDTSSFKNKIYNLNYRFSNLENLTAKDVSFSQGDKIVQRLTDYTYWVFDTKGLAGIKYNIINQPVYQTNDIINTKTNLKYSLSAISQIEIDRYENLYIYDNFTKKYVVIDTNGNFKYNGILDKNTNSIQIDLNGNVIPCFGNQSAVDSKNNIWEIIGGNLYRNKKIFGNIGFVQQISFDADDYIWILHGQDNLTKINTTNNQVIFSKRIGKYSSLPPDPCFDYIKQSRFMNFVRVPKDDNSDPCDTTLNSSEDRLVLIDLNDNNIYTINSSGAILTKLSLTGLTNNLNVKMLSYGDFTGYQYLRKYASVNKQLSWKLKLATPNGKNPTPSVDIKILPYNISDITPGWHHFSLVFDSTKGTIKAYLDSVQQGDTVTFNPNVYQLYYIYRTSLLLGCETIQNTTLNDIIAIDNGYKFVGQVAELRLYNKSLTQGEIEQLYFSSNRAADDRSLLWNMSVGERNYIEQIKHWYKMQMPGNKSKYFNINIHNLNVPDQVKQVIESGIKNNLNKIAPANTSLYKINWK